MLEESVSSSPTFWAGLLSWFTPTVFFLVLQLVIGTIFIISSLANNNHHKHPHEQDPQHQVHEFLYPQQQQQQPLARSPSVLQRLKSINFYSYPYRSHDHENEQQQHHQQQLQPQLARSPSSMLQRLKSINLYSYFPTESFSSKVPTDTHVTYETHAPEKPHSLEKKPHAPEKMRALEKAHAPVEEMDEELMKEENDDFVEDKFDEGASLEEIYSQLQGQGGHFTRTHSDTKPASGEVPVKLPKKMKKSASSKSAFAHFKEDDIVESRRPATVKEAKVSTAVDDDEVDAKADDFINKFKQQLKLQRIDSIMRYKEMIGRGASK